VNPRTLRLVLSFFLLLVSLAGRESARGEAMLQYFNTDWRDLTAKIPELAEAGYNSLWVPPPTKGSGGLSVGYDLWDRFDLGSKDQRGSVRTRYGTEAELLQLIETAHRFGIRVYFDNIMNHNAFDIPGYNSDTPIDIYPGFVPEDFHLRITEDGFYRKWDNTRSWGDTWQVQNLGLSDLIDIAHESPNTNHGRNEGDDIPKISFIRHPNNPEYYLDLDLPVVVSNSGGSFNVYTFANKEPWQDQGYTDGNATVTKTTLGNGYIVYNGGGATVGTGNGRFDFKDLNGNGQHDAGEPCEPFADTGVDPADPSRKTTTWGWGDNKYNMGNPVSEDVNAMLIRSVRWLIDRTKVDGLRLDAVKHVPDYFFGQQGGADKDRSSAGYLGKAQEQFNLSRDFSDWGNHRDSVFDTEVGRDDALMFGEHLGQPPGYGGYWDAGMRLVDNDLRNELNNRLGNPSNGLNGFDQPGAGGFQANLGVTHAQSHDNDYAARRELQHAYYFTRAGLPLIYTDGNNHAGVLGESGGAFPRHSNTNFLGQFGDVRVPNLLYIHNQFARGYQVGRWSDADFIAYERIDKRENGSMSDADGVTMLFMMNDNFANGLARSFQTSFPSGAYLFNYSSYGGGFYKYAGELNTVVVPPGGYFVFSWRNPEEVPAWRNAGGKPITILQNGQPTGTVSYERRDGRDGDPNFNPNNVPGDTAGDYKYAWTVPRVTSGSALSFIARADASAENILLSLDGGVDINSPGVSSHTGLGPQTGELRDHPPAVSTDTFLGYEQAQFVSRQYGEKFAATSTSRNKFGSPGAETYRTTVGTGIFAVTNATGDFDTGNDGGTAAFFFYHDPAAGVGGVANPPQQYAESGSSISLWAKPNNVGLGYKAFIYYTTDGTNPEGAGGVGTGTTKVAVMTYQHPEGSPNPGDWWKGEITPKPAGELRYKLSIYKDNDGTNPVASIFPGGPDEVARKVRGMTKFQITNFNAGTAKVRPHNDYGEERTGLAEGFHVIRARAFLKRDGRASIYNTFTQTFYYDTQTPGGEIRFPGSNGDTVGGQQYGVVVRTDPSVTEVWYHIDDTDASNNDSATGTQGGNGGGPEPFTDADGDGARDANEPFTDINGNGSFDPSLPETWAKASESTFNGTGAYTREWRFNYRNIPATGGATIRVRLLELSSSRNMMLTPAAAHVTELARTVNTAGPDLRMFIAFPQQDGQTVGEGYVMKTRFSKALADGVDLNNAQQRAAFLSRFIVRIASQESGSPAGAVTQSTTSYALVQNSTNDTHDFAFTLPNVYNGVPDFLHTIQVTLNRDGAPDLVTTRLIRAQITQPAVFVNIVHPPEFDSDGKRHEILLPDVVNPTPALRRSVIEVETDAAATGVSIAFANNAATATPIDQRTDGSHKFWRFEWANMTEGAFTFTANVQTDGDPAPEATATRNATVIFREIVSSTGEPFTDANGNGVWDAGENFTDLNGDGQYTGPFIDDNDDDDDGLGDLGETTVTALPTSNSDTWTNGQVHVYHAYGMTNHLSPDTDGDGLPDGVEVGWRVAGNPPTNPATDTDGDTFKNFIGDLDPPFYNTTDNLGSVPNVNTVNEGGDRARQVAGSVTNPNNPDTDGDGIRDGVEDRNRNGWTDGDGASLAANANPTLGRAWPNNVMNPGETWLETSATKADSDADGLSDGYGEDRNFNGLLDGDADGDRTYDAGEAWTETNPLKADTDGDGLPDGWESQRGLDPLDNGSDSLRTAAAGDGSVNNGAAGDPDGDGFTNLQELANGTDPKQGDTGVPPPANSITIGPVQPPTVVGGVTNAREFTDWTLDDLLVLDEYEGDGTNNQGGDIYPAGDGFDSSRDLVAFYAHDGGDPDDPAQGGDGNFYFRVDLQDLRPFAEDGNLDIYVVVDTGNPASGEYALPDDTDAGTEMRWEAVIAVYSGNNGRVYVDTANTNNSTAIGQGLTGYGVVARDQNSTGPIPGGIGPNGFKKAYFNSELDAVEFSISRQALRDAGWNGLNAAQLNFQVFTTKDGTGNSPVGPGDLGGRLDVRDTIYDDYLAEDYYNNQSGISGDKGVLRGYFSKSGSNDRGKRAKVISLIHGNQAIQPGSTIQALINTAAGAGYYRPLEAHEAYGAPVAMHITPTLASAIQWAKADPASPRQYRDGPALNAQMKSLAQSGVANLLGSTFSDHMLAYFPSDFNAANVGLANQFLSAFYDNRQSARTLWNPERVADSATLAQISGLGYTHTFVDQMRHVLKWFGRTSALSNDGYRINLVNGVRCFVINDTASTYRFQNTDNGLAAPLRELLSRKARSGTQDQVVILLSAWEDFTSKANADAYDRNLRWMASRPWIQIVTPDQIAAGQVDLSQPPDGMGDTWGTVNRGSGLTLAKVTHDFLDHATQESYDNWYHGQAGREEGLKNKRFEIRQGTLLPAGKEFGLLTAGTGIVSQAWGNVAGTLTPNLASLARGTAGAAAFQTAFHNQTNNDLSKYSTGAYIYPDTDSHTLAGFAKATQSQFRFAAVFKRVETWAAAAGGGVYENAAATAQEDVDLDGENEFLIFNDRIFALFERIGGRMTAGWVRDIHTGAVFQVIGNFLSYAGGETEAEGAVNVSSGAVSAHRVSGFRDQFLQTDAQGNGTTQYVNDLYSVTAATGGVGWKFTSSDGKIAKNITLQPRGSRLIGSYVLTGGAPRLYVRFGLSPHLGDLLVHGQENLTEKVPASGFFGAGNQLSVKTSATNGLVRAFVRPASSNFALNLAAVDRDSGVTFDTINMRNLAQTRQVEGYTFGDSGILVELGMQTGATVSEDSDGDGIPDWWEAQFGLDAGSASGANGAAGDLDGDGIGNLSEFIAGTSPLAPNTASPQVAVGQNANGHRTLRFQTIRDRSYRIRYTNDLTQAWQSIVPAISGTGGEVTWTDDGTQTGGSMAVQRFYRVEVLPPTVE
jgi:glycosidase